MTKPFPALCVHCAHSEPDESSAWTLRCTNPKVNAKDNWALSAVKVHRGSTCSQERDRKWPAPCGMRGAQWTPKSGNEGSQ